MITLRVHLDSSMVKISLSLKPRSSSSSPGKSPNACTSNNTCTIIRQNLRVHVGITCMRHTGIMKTLMWKTSMLVQETQLKFKYLTHNTYMSHNTHYNQHLTYRWHIFLLAIFLATYISALYTFFILFYVWSSISQPIRVHKLFKLLP